MIDQEQPRRRWAIRFSLRTLLIFISLVGAFLGGHITPSSADRKLATQNVELQAKVRELSIRVSTEEVLRDQQRLKLENALSWINDLDRGRSPPGTRTFFLDPVPVRPQPSVDD